MIEFWKILAVGLLCLCIGGYVGREAFQLELDAQLTSHILFTNNTLYACSKVDPIKPESF